MNMLNLEKLNALVSVFRKHWRSTFGAIFVIGATIALIAKVISIEAYAAIISAMVTAGYLPKKKKDEDE